MQQRLIDKELVKLRFEQSADTYREHALIQREMAEKLAAEIRRSIGGQTCNRVLEIGCGSGFLTEKLFSEIRMKRLVANDIVGSFRRDILRVSRSAPSTETEFLEGDIEAVPLPGDLDLVASNAVFQWLSDMESFLDRISESLRPGAVMGFTTFGTHNLREVSAVTGLSLGYRSCEDYCRLLHRHFEIITGREEERAVDMNTPLAVLRHMKATGANAIEHPYWKRGDLDRFSRRYVAQFGHDGKVPLTYNPLYFVCRRR